VCDDQIRMRKKREREKEKSETPKTNRKKRSDTREGKSDTHERKLNCVVSQPTLRREGDARLTGASSKGGKCVELLVSEND